MDQLKKYALDPHQHPGQHAVNAEWRWVAGWLRPGSVRRAGRRESGLRAGLEGMRVNEPQLLILPADPMAQIGSRRREKPNRVWRFLATRLAMFGNGVGGEEWKYVVVNGI
ncbi:hypothetical protein PIB30_062758 [Stylosanthes scabra]|uniref:Uncharacterized protein n=1 Tax=Stylosanthes scabra TaxID=79078 RepID=A0ABU6UM62_9FABA|nr:hypothetical protein [Stylosanthes scabra]